MTGSGPAFHDLSPDEFRNVIGHFATGVTVITAVEGADLFGTTASAVTSLSLEPPMLLICMSRQSSTGGCVSRVGRFAVNILNEHQGHLARRFATKAPTKFAGVDLLMGLHGEPLLADALAHVECRVVEEVLGGSHTVFLAQVHRASAGVGRPLAYYRGEFGRLVVDASTESDMQDALRALCASELGAAFLTVGQVPSGRLAKLRELINAPGANRHGSSGPEPTIDDVLKTDQLFHSELIALAGSPPLIAAYERLAASAPAAQWLRRTNSADSDIMADDICILEAYERGDFVGAAEAIRRHYLV